jgi:hypothetical protein
MARHGSAGLGMARQGPAGQVSLGEARLGVAACGLARQVSCGEARRGTVGQGRVWQGNSHLTVVHDSCYNTRELRKGEL